eukprot:m.89244 g.89244  ORF g.89244 m.89244 type:complete len:732 (+) comp11720_c0_seq1:37-2232(+)
MVRGTIAALVGAVLAVLAGHSAGETVDVVQPHHLPPAECPHGCAVWSDLASSGSDVNQTAVDELWRSKAAQAAAGSKCAQPGRSPFSDGNTVGGYAGAYCFCAVELPTDPRVGYCLSAPDTPEQINLQVSPAPDTLIAAFVTFGPSTQGVSPIAQVGTDAELKGPDTVEYTGVTHQYLSPSSDNGVPQPVRPYNMHFVPITGLKEKTTYYYRVASGPQNASSNVPNATVCHGWTCTVQNQFCPPGTPGATPPSGDRCCSGAWVPGDAPCSVGWSDIFHFRSLYAAGSGVGDGQTRVAIFGDMGMMSDGNTMHGNILRDAEVGLVDAFVHMGDHAYQMSSADDRRGDGYMNNYQPLATQVPWIPVIGNHEYYDNAYFHRYLNQTFGVQLPEGPVPAGFCGHDNGCADADELSGRHPTLAPGEKITADSALGTLLARTRVVAHSAHPHTTASVPANGVPSNTSRWYSVNVGLIHMVALDIMVYPGSTPDPGPADHPYAVAQRAWLEEDLSAVDRAATPWVLAFAHHPLYCSSTTMGKGTSEAPEGDSILASDAAWGGPEQGELTQEQRDRIPQGKGYAGCLGTGVVGVNARKDLEPLLLQHGVDMFLAGHEHDYESIWPVKDCAIGSPNCYIGTSFDTPKAPVHVVCGEGGTNGGDHFGSNWGPWTRKQLGQDTPGECTTLSSGGPTQGGCSAGYGRITAHNSSHLTYEYVLNVNGSVWDSFTIHQPHHSPFA